MPSASIRRCGDRERRESPKPKAKPPKPCRTSAAFWTTDRSMRSSLPRPTIGTPRRPSGRARRAKTCTSRSRPATALGRPQNGRGRPQVQTHRATRHAEPQRPVHPRRQAVHRRGQAGQDPPLPRSHHASLAQLSPWRPTAIRLRASTGTCGTVPPPSTATIATFRNNWHHFWRYSGGDIINNGVHSVDLGRYLCGVEYPRSVHASGGRFDGPGAVRDARHDGRDLGFRRSGDDLSK